MEIPENIRTAAVFLVQDRGDGNEQTFRRVACGTAFLVVVLASGGSGYSYVVTARHNLEACKKDRDLFVRLNTQNGAYKDVAISHDSWHQHPMTDAAITHFHIPDDCITACIPHGMLLSN